MTGKINHVEKLERIMEQLADSVLELSDEAILAEVSEAGADLAEEAERAHSVLRNASRAWENVNQQLSYLGHTITPTSWQRKHGVYHNRCLKCDSAVSFRTATGEAQGMALEAPCREGGQQAMPRREVSRR